MPKLPPVSRRQPIPSDVRSARVDVIAMTAATFNRLPGRRSSGEPACPPDHWAAVVNVTPNDHDWRGEIMCSHSPLDDHRPSDIVMHGALPHIAERLGINPDRLDVVLINDVPEWQVDPGEPPISRAEGLHRLESAAQDPEPAQIREARERVAQGLAHAWSADA
jgi:hypothetical protein